MMVPEQVGSGYLSRERMETQEESMGQQPVKGEVAQERPPSQPGGGQQQLIHCSR